MRVATLLAPGELDWIVQGLLAALVAGLLASALAGLLLLARPALLLRLNARLSRQVETARHFGRLDAPIVTERWFYRRHSFVGAALVLGSCYVLARWAWAYERAGLLSLLGRRWRGPELAWLPVGLECALVALHAAILVLGFVVLARPSLLKRLESAANRSYVVRAARLDAVVARPDAAVRQFPRLCGLALLLAAGACLAALVPAITGSTG